MHTTNQVQVEVSVTDMATGITVRKTYKAPSVSMEIGELELHFKASGLLTLKKHKKPTNGASSLRINTFLQ